MFSHFKSEPECVISIYFKCYHNYVQPKPQKTYICMGVVMNSGNPKVFNCQMIPQTSFFLGNTIRLGLPIPFCGASFCRFFHGRPKMTNGVDSLWSGMFFLPLMRSFVWSWCTALRCSTWSSLFERSWDSQVWSSLLQESFEPILESFFLYDNFSPQHSLK